MPEEAAACRLPGGCYSAAVRDPRPAGFALAVALLLAPASRAGPLPGPLLTLELEGQFSQLAGAQTRGGAGALGAALRLSDQIFFTGAFSQALTSAGPISTLGAGVRALFDATPVAPFAELQFVLLIPSSRPGYQLATRIGGGADLRLTPQLAVGLAARALTPLDTSAAALTGLELALRLTWTPGTGRPQPP
jgi:hypothetical protein